MTNLRQAAQRALKAMEDGEYRADMIEFSDALIALRAALAEPEQEPVAWLDPDSGEVCRASWLNAHAPERDVDRFNCPLYTAPTPRKPLTDEEISAILDDTLEGGSFFDVALAVARAIERAHGITGETNE